MADSEDPIPTTETGPDGGSAQDSTVPDAEWEAMSNVLNTVYEHRLEDGYDPSKVFHRKVNKRTLPGYYNVIKEPMALSTIKAKVNGKEYKSFSEYVRDFALIPYNAQVYNRPDAPAYQDALTIKELLEKEFSKLAKDGVISEEVAKLPYIGEIPAQDDVDPVEEAEEEEEEEGDDEDEEDEDEDEDEDEEGGRRKKKRGPRSSTAIAKREGKGDGVDTDARKRRGRPPRVDTPMEAKIKAILKGLRKSKNNAGQLMISHFERLPDKAVMPEYFNEIKQPIALDSIKKKLKRKKYQSIDQFLRDIELMFENAKQYNLDDSIIYKDAVQLQKEARKLADEERKKPDTDYAMEDGRIPLPHIIHNGEVWKVGDWVHIQNANDLTKPIVAQIYRTWADGDNNKWVNACWYYRPEQTVHRFDRHFFDNEVVKTGQYRDHPIDEVVDRAFVMFFTRYNKGRPRNFPPDKEIYVCESRYNEEKHKLNKIKTWASCLPDEVRDKDYEMDLFDAPKKMKKIPSPIAYLLKDDAKETDDLPKPVWGAENAPPKIGAVHKRPRDPKESPPPEPTPTPPPQPPPQPVRHVSNVSGPTTEQQPSYNMSGAAAQHQSPRTATPSHPQLQQRQSFASSHPARYQPQSASPAPFQAQNAPNSQHGGFQPPPLTPHGSFQAAGAANTPQAQFTNYTTPQSYQPRPVQPNYQAMQQQPPPQYGGPTGATASLTPTPIGGLRGYNAPQPPEVYCLSDVANASIPEDIRQQFHCDEQGRILFFTAPPIEAGAPQAFSLHDSLEQKKGDGDKAARKEELKLGHSVRYLAARAKRDALIAEKRKREASDTATRAPDLKRQKLQAEVQLQEQLSATISKAVAGLEHQLVLTTKLATADVAQGASLRRELQRDLELLGAKWTAAAEKDKISAQKEDARAEKESRSVQLVL